MFRNSLLVILALSTSGMLGCGDNIKGGAPEVASGHITAATTQGAAIEIDATATDPAGRTLTYTASEPAHGTISGTGPKFTYTPDAGFSGTDELTITISNGQQTTTITVTITVAAPSAPVTSDGTFYIARNTAGAVTLTATDADTDAASLSFTVVAAPQHGALTGTPPYLTYTPDTDYAGADSFTYEASDGTATSNVATAAIDVTICGDGTKTPNEQCDDGNNSDEDGCSGSCQKELCGDGVIQLGLDEQCDDGNMVDGDGCSATCIAEPALNTLPIMVSGALTGCTTEPANAGTKVAADTADIYGVFRCGSNGYVVVSHDHGETYSTPFPLVALVPGPAVDTVDHVAVSIGIAGVAYVAYVLDSGNVYLRRSVDHGVTWGTATLIGVTSSVYNGVSLGSFNHFVYLAYATGTLPPFAPVTPQPVNPAVTVRTNHSDGNGDFDTQVLITPDSDNFDLLFDPTINVMALAVDNTSFTVRVSSNQSETWSQAIPASGTQATGDWSLGGAHLYVSGIDDGSTTNSDTLFYYTPNLSQTPEAGLPSVTTLRSRSLAADMVGDAFIASQLDGLNGGIQLDRYIQAEDGFDASRQINATGTHPSVTNLRSYTGAAVIYTDNDQAWISVQAYDQGYTCPPNAPC